MKWLSSIRKAIGYMEDHLTDDISAKDVAEQVRLRERQKDRSRLSLRDLDPRKKKS